MRQFNNLIYIYVQKVIKEKLMLGSYLVFNHHLKNWLKVEAIQKSSEQFTSFDKLCGRENKLRKVLVNVLIEYNFPQRFLTILDTKLPWILWHYSYISLFCVQQCCWSIHTLLQWQFIDEKHQMKTSSSICFLQK